MRLLFMLLQTRDHAFKYLGMLIFLLFTIGESVSGGTETTCYRFTVAGAPMGAETGPYCPPSIESSAEEGGTWIDGKGTVYDVDGRFIENLADLYNDDEWQMYDTETGKITVIDGAKGCEVAAPPECRRCLKRCSFWSSRAFGNDS